jgi:hypothetical protein
MVRLERVSGKVLFGCDGQKKLIVCELMRSKCIMRITSPRDGCSLPLVDLFVSYAVS